MESLPQPTNVINLEELAHEAEQLSDLIRKWEQKENDKNPYVQEEKRKDSDQEMTPEGGEQMRPDLLQ